MIEDFRIAVANAWRVRQEMMGLDTRKIWPYHLPEVAATDEQILSAEQSLGHSIDPRYKAFLKCANGWLGFYQAVDLFGTEDLVHGARKEKADHIFGYLEDAVLEKSRLKRAELLPIAVSRNDKDLFVITRTSSHFPGKVIWFAGEEIDHFLNFDEYFLSMVEYNRVAIRRFKEALGK